MMLIAQSDIPRHVISKALASGLTAFYWNPHITLLAPINGRPCPLKRQPLGTDFEAMKVKAADLNTRLDFWRTHGRPQDEAAPTSAIVPGSFDHMLQTYRAASPRKKGSYAQLRPKTRYKFDYMTKRFANALLINGQRVGAQQCAEFTPDFVSKLYDRLVEVPDREVYGPPRRNTPVVEGGDLDLLRDGDNYFDKRGRLWIRSAPIRRTMNEMMAYCRSAWSTAHRATPKLVPADNPFSKMKLDHTAKETKPASIAQLEAFETKALELGEPVVAFVARCAWEMLQRPDEIINSFARGHWRPAENPLHAFVGNDKTGEKVWKRVAEIDPETREVILFYPELEAIIAAVPRLGPMMCSYEFRKGPKPKARDDDRAVVIKQFSVRLLYRHAEDVRVVAGLPDHCTLASFRHGGMTECGDAGLSDTQAQALSRHKKRETMTRYIHRTDRQVTAATTLRLAYRRSER